MAEKAHIIRELKGYTIAYKPAGMPTQPDRTGDQSIIETISEISNRHYFICQRIDRPVSGCVVLAHSSSKQASFSRSKTVKTYIAIVENKKSITPEGSIIGYLSKDALKRRAIYSNSEKANYKRVRLDYKKMATTDRYHILKIELLTGKYHQIRALLSYHLGCPIKGDVKYGARRANRDRSIHLHCYSIYNESLKIDVTTPKQHTDDVLWDKAMELITKD